jgi:hypothetical protein
VQRRGNEEQALEIDTGIPILDLAEVGNIQSGSISEIALPQTQFFASKTHGFSKELKSRFPWGP